MTSAYPSDPSEIDAFLASGGALALLFSASWCAAGVLLSRDLSGVSTGLVVVDCDAFPHVADRFQVRSLPTLLLMEGLKERGRLLGAFSPADARLLLTKVSL